MLVIGNGFLPMLLCFKASFRSGPFDKIVLFIVIADFLHKLVNAKATLDIDENNSQFLTFINDFRIGSSILSSVTPFLRQAR